MIPASHNGNPNPATHDSMLSPPEYINTTTLAHIIPKIAATPTLKAPHHPAPHPMT